MRRFTPLVAGLTAALIAVLSAATPGIATTPTRSPIALGASEPQWYDMNAVDTYSAAVGRQPAIWSVWSDWGDPNTGPFPTQVMNGLFTRGIVPQVYWEPLDPSYQGFDCANWSLDNIIAGDHDNYIKDWATAAATYGHPIILRFAHEMNGYWYVWADGSPGICGNTTKKFRKAWKHVWNLFRGPGGANATNVNFEFSVINGNLVAANYPGNAYVDYLGITALDWATTKKWRTLVQAMTPAMNALSLATKTKPIIASEVAAGYNPNCAKCDKAAFFAQGYQAVYDKWPQVVAIVYFDYDMTGPPNYQDDWRLNSPPAAMTAYKAIVANPNFQGTFP